MQVLWIVDQSKLVVLNYITILNFPAVFKASHASVFDNALLFWQNKVGKFNWKYNGVNFNILQKVRLYESVNISFNL